MLPPHIKAIVNQIEKAIDQASRRADERNRAADEQRRTVSASVDSLTEEFKAYQAKQEAAEPAKRRRENSTLGALIAAAAFSLLLAGLSACQLKEMRKAYEPLRQSAEAASKQATAGRAYLFVQPASGQFGGVDPKGQDATGTYRPFISFSIKNFGPTPAIITNIETHLYLSDGTPTDIIPVPKSPEAKVMGEATAWNIEPVDRGANAFQSIDTSDSSTRVMLAANTDSGPLQQTFVFNKGLHTTHGGWFYCAVTYKDIFGERDRHTYLYIRLAGSGFSYPRNSEYNSWD